MVNLPSHAGFRLSWLAVGLCVAGVGGSSEAIAHPHPRSKTQTEVAATARYVQLPAGPLSEQLARLATLFDRSFVAPSTQVKQQQVHGLQGHYTLTQALDLLLQGTQLTYRLIDDLAKDSQSSTGGFIIEAKPGKAATATSVADPIAEVTTLGNYHPSQRSRQLQQASTTVATVITAEQMANYPDNNLAESLRRMPGITMTRGLGEGQQISLRGIYPDFTLVTLNGMPVLSNNDLPMDSRGQKQQDRGFDFNLFAPSLFDHVVVNKSYSADQSAGGLAGNLAIALPKPFDNPETHGQWTTSLTSNSYAGGADKGIDGMLSSTWGNWGTLLAVNWQQRQVLGKGANTFRWRRLAPDVVFNGVNEEIKQAWQQQQLIMPRGNRYSLWNSHQTRVGAHLGLQYQNQQWDISIDGLVGSLRGLRRESHIYSRGVGMTPVDEGVTQLTSAAVNDANELVYAHYNNADIATESRRQQVETDYRQWVFFGRYHWNPRLTMGWRVGSQRSSYDMPYSAKAYAHSRGPMTIDYISDRFFADIHFSDELHNSSAWLLSEVDLEQYDSESRHRQVSVFADYQWSNTTKLSAGLEFNWQDSRRWLVTRDNLLVDYLRRFDQPLTGNLGTLVNGVAGQKWRTPYVTKMLAAYGIDADIGQVVPELGNPPLTTTADSRFDEQRRAGYVQLQWHWLNSDWQAGVRITDSKTDADNYLLNTADTIESTNILPALNVTVPLTEREVARWQLQASLSRSLAHPMFNDLATKAITTSDGAGIIGIDPELSPYLSHNADLSLSYYGDDVLFSVTGFYKSIDDYIALQPRASGPVRVWRTNSESAQLKGVEAELDWRWSALPEPFNYFGMRLQGSINEGNVSYYDEASGERLFDKAFPYLSDYSAALSFYYQQREWQAQLSIVQQDDYIIRVDSDTLADENETGFLASTYVDASAHWQLNQDWRVNFEATNLTNERDVQYSDSAKRAYNAISYGRSLSLGVTYQW